MKSCNKIDDLEKEYLLKVNPNKFIDDLEYGDIFKDWIQKDLYLNFNFDTLNLCNTDKINLFNNISIIGIYNIIFNLVGIFSYDLLSKRHKDVFINNIKPFNISNELAINISLVSTLDMDNQLKPFSYSFNSALLLNDLICTTSIGIYEHKIFMDSSNSFLTNCFFLYESFVNTIYNDI